MQNAADSTKIRELTEKLYSERAAMDAAMNEHDWDDYEFRETRIVAIESEIDALTGTTLTQEAVQ